jgi:glycosyltransferase involved in cell wall biosynthesis
MLLAHLTASQFFGGPERQMLQLAQSLPSEIRSAFISFSESGLCSNFLEQVRKAGFEAIALRCDTPRLLAAWRELVSVLRGIRADCLCCHGYKADLLGLLAARRLGIPVVAISRGWTGECMRVRLYEALDRRILRRMDRIICVSEAQARKVRCAGVRPERIQVIYNAIRPERFERPDAAYRERLRRMFPTPPQKIVGAAGRLSPEKGFSIFVDAAADVLKTRPDVGFVLFGDGTLRSSLGRQIASLGMEDRFILAGFRPDFDAFLPHLDLMVLPSFTEGLPNVVLEALAANVPVVATAAGGTGEIIEDGKTGFLVPPGDAGRLAARTLDALGDESARQRLLDEGRARVERHFSFTTQARLYQSLLGSLLRAGDVAGGCNGQS